ncbi:reverse transcriptase [Gossypium australe]|uniref:Reverse transcriptase n=1 Tax=Gossypium australe TaxID=47621 RepID=A0A5B6WFC1_9ROSI|nr:reverse transcriptase [Gossypium australe]
MEEIWEALTSMGATKAPREDGFPAIFFQKFWHVIGDEVSTYCLQQLNGDMEVSQINTTHIVLIPKKTIPTNLSHFRPISLCNVIYKIMAKAIANQFRGVLEKCIDKAQSAFVPGRLISNNVLVAYEILHTLKRKKLGEKGLMAVKLDMSKAYDRVEWTFLQEIMRKMGFEPSWIESIMKCISTISYSVVLNRQVGSIFYPTRELRQGDPLSPFLFLICGEGLSSLMRLTQREENFKGVKASRRGPQISHLLFEDDCILFGEATKRGAGLLKRILWEYRNCSGQQEILKSLRFSLVLIQETKKRELLLECSYYCEILVAERSWSKGHPLVYLEGALHFKGIGGLGFRSLDQFNIALLAKQGWRLINYPNSLLPQVLKAKYFPNSNFIYAQLGNLPSLTWRSVWATKGLLQYGLCWRFGKGDRIAVWNDQHIAQKILQIPLAEEEHEDFQVWRGEHSGKFTCRSTEEDCNHVFRQCPTTTELWLNLNLSWVINSTIIDLWDWLTWVFDKGSSVQWRDLSKKVQSYVVEIDRSNEEKHSCDDNKRQRQNTRKTKATIFFDVTFDGKNARSASGLVVRGEMDEWLASKSVIHSAIASPFMSEAYAGLQATKLGITLGFQSITISGDSK